MQIVKILWLVVATFIEINGTYALPKTDFVQNSKDQSTSFLFLKDLPTQVVSGKIMKYTELSSGNQILFSDDGLQPTAAEAVIWSCANIEDECVTAWYESMFGLYEEKLLGFNIRNEACKIIDFELGGLNSFEADDFTSAFRMNFHKIASVSVGRVLLYRILLEIQRISIDENGCMENAADKKILNQRNLCRSIVIQKSNHGNSFFLDDKDKVGINFTPSANHMEINVISITKESTTKIIKKSRTDDIGIFHEMLHWFHALRDMNRLMLEINVKSKTRNIYAFASNIIMKNENTMLWMGQNNKEFIIKMEEFRTIMGYTVNVIKKGGDMLYSVGNPLNGDDLCENLYRICVGQDLRYGHVNVRSSGEVLTLAIENAKNVYDIAIREGGYKIH